MNKTQAVAAVLLFITLEAFADSPKAPVEKPAWDWLEMAYEIGYDSPYWEEAREKSNWGGRARLSLGVLPNLHLTGSYGLQRFDEMVDGVHSQETFSVNRYGLGTHVNVGAGSAVALEVTRMESQQKERLDDFQSAPFEEKGVVRGFACFAGVRTMMSTAALEFGYEVARLKDEVKFSDKFDPAQIDLKLGTLSAQLLAPLTRRISFTMRFEQVAYRSKTEQPQINLHRDTKKHAENLLLGLRFSL